MRQIQNLESGDDDSLYNRFLYRLTLDEYCSNGSRNTRCRSLVPKEHQPMVSYIWYH